MNFLKSLENNPETARLLGARSYSYPRTKKDLRFKIDKCDQTALKYVIELMVFQPTHSNLI